MLFLCQKYHADTCGNNWKDGEPWYVDASSMSRVVAEYGEVVAYTDSSRPQDDVIHRARTPKGKGYGQWEKNPYFNPKTALKKGVVKYVEIANGLGRIVISEIEPVRLT